VRKGASLLRIMNDDLFFDHAVGVRLFTRAPAELAAYGEARDLAEGAARQYGGVDQVPAQAVAAEALEGEEFAGFAGLVVDQAHTARVFTRGEVAQQHVSGPAVVGVPLQAVGEVLRRLEAHLRAIDLIADAVHRPAQFLGVGGDYPEIPAKLLRQPAPGFCVRLGHPSGPPRAATLYII
jgi:hypothetical protein